MFNRSKIAIRRDILVRSYRTLVDERYSLLFRFLASFLLVSLVSGICYFWLANRLDRERVITGLTEAVFEHTGYDLHLEDLDWRWSPSLVLRLQGIRITLPGSGVPLAHMDEAIVDVAMLSILSPNQSILVDKITLVGFTSGLLTGDKNDGYSWVLTSEEGGTIKVPLFPANEPARFTVRTSAESSSLPTTFAVDELVFKQAGLHYQAEDLEFRLAFEVLQLQDLLSNDWVSSSASGSLLIPGSPRVNFDLNTLVNRSSARRIIPEEELSADRSRVIDINVQQRRGEVQVEPSEEPSESPLLADFSARVVDGRVSFDDSPLHQLSGDISLVQRQARVDLEMTGEINLKLSNLVVNILDAGIDLDGRLGLSTENPPALARFLGQPVPVPLQKFGLEGFFKYTREGLFLNNAELSVNDQRFSGNLAWITEPSPEEAVHKVRISLNGSRFALDPWVYELSFVEQLPPAWKWEFLLQLHALEFAGLEIEGIDLQSRSDGQKILATATADQFLSGSFNGQLAADLSLKAADWQMRFINNGMDIEKVSDWLGFPLSVSGRLNLSGQASLAGRSLQRVAESARLNLQFLVNNGVFENEGIRALASELAYMTGDQEAVKKWPETFDFDRLTGSLQMGTGTGRQFLDVKIDDLEIKAMGAADPFHRLMDFDVGILIRSSSEAEAPMKGYLQDIEWPVVCMGSWQSNVPCRLAHGPLLQRVVRQVEDDKRRLFWLENSLLNIPDDSRFDQGLR